MEISTGIKVNTQPESVEKSIDQSVPTIVTENGQGERPILLSGKDKVLTNFLQSLRKETQKKLPLAKIFHIIQKIHNEFEYNPNYMVRVQRQLEARLKIDGLNTALPLGEMITFQEPIISPSSSSKKMEYVRRQPERPYVGECTHMSALCALAFKELMGSGSYTLINNKGAPHAIAGIKLFGLHFYADTMTGKFIPPWGVKNEYESSPTRTIDIK